MTEFSPEAEALARVLVPRPTVPLGPYVRMAQRAIDAGWVHRDDLVAEGWTPPPDPHEAIARELHGALFDIDHAERDLLAVVRRIPDDLARQVAEALRGES